jgi:dipeptidyl-peptidase-4
VSSPPSFPRQQARTQRFTLGQPHAPTVAAGGERVVFLRSAAGDDRRTALWVLDVADGSQRLVADPVVLLGGDEEHLPPVERARRERARETAAGVVAYSADRGATTAAFVLSGRLFVADLVGGGVQELAVPGQVFDPRLDPTGRRIAYESGGVVYAVTVDGSDHRRLTPTEPEGITWGAAEFVAAEEMDRSHGFWWAHDGSALLATRVDERGVRRWWITDSAHPDREPAAVRYPPPGTDNAEVSLHLLDLDGESRAIHWDAERFPYLARVSWGRPGAPLVAVQARDQRSVRVLEVDPATGATSVLREDADDAWVDLYRGVPDRLDDGRLVWIAATGDAHRLVVGDVPVTPDGLQVRAVASTAGNSVLFTASDDPVEVHAWRWSDAGLERLSADSGVHAVTGAGGTIVLSSAGPDHDGTLVSVTSGSARLTVASYAETPCVTPQVRMLTLGKHDLRAGLLLPSDHEPGRRLPVLLDPYGGPGAQRVLAARAAWLTPQWLADQGFAVLVTDNRGTPGRGPAWERTLLGDLAGPVLDDQVDALLAAAGVEPDLDLSRVGIRGWSFGGYLAALAVLRRPDVFSAAVAGAPVTDWRLYDTHYTERYLGIDPDGADREAYERSSLLADAARLERPLLLIHGLADDNVVVAHTLQLSQRLTESGRAHTVLPLSGVTHMTPQEAVAENLLLLQVEFLRRALG